LLIKEEDEASKRASCTHNSAFFFLDELKLYKTKHKLQTHQRNLVQTITWARRKPKTAHSKALTTKTKCRRQSAASTYILTSKLEQNIQTNKSQQYLKLNKTREPTNHRT
jgi:hypothetical protein